LIIETLENGSNAGDYVKMTKNLKQKRSKGGAVSRNPSLISSQPNDDDNDLKYLTKPFDKKVLEQPYLGDLVLRLCYEC
jgi:hypothetical protein